MSDDQNSYYTNPLQHNPIASSEEIQHNERAWYVPPAPSSSNMSTAPPPVYYRGGGGGAATGRWAPAMGRSGVGDFGLNVVIVGFLWEVWACLYPLPAAAAYLSLVIGIVYLPQFVPRSSIFAPGLYAVVLDFAIAAVVLWTVSRLDHKLARITVYRIARHLVRLSFLAFAGATAMRLFEGIPYQVVMQNSGAILGDTKALVAGAITAAAAHFLLWNLKPVRNWWHRRLEAARLRPIGV